jgi:hypothetical protein
MKIFSSGAGAAGAATLLLLAICYTFGGAPAGAAGTALIRQSNGHTDVYENVAIKVIHDALFVTSADGKGTLVIHRAACAFQGALLVCFPTSAVLVQAGQTKALSLKEGTVYVNTTDAPQQLALSTAKVPAHGILLSLTTKRGTYVSLSGRFDKVVK